MRTHAYCQPNQFRNILKVLELGRSICGFVCGALFWVLTLYTKETKAIALCFVLAIQQSH